MVSVPCNGCIKCYFKDAVRLLPGDSKEFYATEPHPYQKGELMLAHNKDGSCIYVSKKNKICTIQEYKPIIYKEMDCRDIAKEFTFTQARTINNFPIQVWKQGRKLISKKQ